MTAVSVRGLRKSYGQYEAVRGIDFDIEPGEVVGFLGPNGAGKTTTVEILEGYRPPTAGTARVLGLDPARAGRTLLARAGARPGARPGPAAGAAGLPSRSGRSDVPRSCSSTSRPPGSTPRPAAR